MRSQVSPVAITFPVAFECDEDSRNPPDRGGGDDPRLKTLFLSYTGGPRGMYMLDAGKDAERSKEAEGPPLVLNDPEASLLPPEVVSTGWSKGAKTRLLKDWPSSMECDRPCTEAEKKRR